MTVGGGNPQFALYLPRVLLEWQARDDPGRYLEIEGTLMMADVSGFTRLSEELAHKGKVGSEEVTRVLNGAFSELLDVASLDGGDLLKFGGDALLHLFTGPDHAARAARSAFDMRDALEEFQSTKSPVPLAMSMGMASGTMQLFLAGGSSSELLIAGHAATEAVNMEATAEAGEILLAPSTVELIDDDDVFGDEKGGGILLDDAPDPDDYEPADTDDAGSLRFSDYVPVRLRSHFTARFNEGEHRSANVAFVKLSGLDDLLDNEGPDIAGPALDTFVAAVQRIAEHYGVCFLASDIAENGCKFIITTGVPDRSDAEEERILRSVYEIAQIESPFSITVGAARGNVFAGDLGSRMRRVYTVMGDTVNLAARLASAAAPGTALVTHKMMDRSQSLFDTVELDPIELKGKSKPIQPIKLGAITGGGEARTTSDLPLIGRREELAALTTRITETKSGDGEAIDLVGVAGMGKSRIVSELVAAAGLPAIVLNAEAYEASTAYFVAGQLVREVLGLKYNIDAEELGHQVTEAVTAMAPDLAPWLPLVARVAAAHVPMTPEVEALDDKFQLQKTAEIVEALLSEVLIDPVLLVIDSAEWTDEASRELLLPLLTVVDQRPWAVCVSRRMGQEWEALSAGTRIELDPLSDAETRELMTLAAADLDIPPTTFDAIAERSGGNPFFIIELVAAAADGTGALPESIEAAAAARIDRLQPADRRFLRYAAVLGHSFTIDLLADALPAVASMIEDPDIWTRLAEFIHTTATGAVKFRQPILRDVAYEGLPFGTRQELHKSVGEALERRARRRPERFAELLSLHFDRAGDSTKSWEYSVMGAERARKKYANVVAAELYRRALAAADNMEADVPTAERAAIAEALGDVTDTAGLHEDAMVAYTLALELSDGGALAKGRLLRKQGMVKEKTGEYDDALGIVQQALDALDGSEGTPESITERLEAMVAYAGVLNRQGDRETSAEWCRKVIESSDGEEDPSALAHAYNLLETNYTDLNHPDRGKFYNKALDIYRELGDLIGQAKVLNNIGYDLYFRGDWISTADYWEQSAEASEKAGDVVTAATVMHNLGEMDVDRGHLDEGRGRLREALRIWRGAGYTGGVAYAHMNLGRLESRAGNRKQAVAHFDSAERAFETVGSRLGVLEVRGRRAADLLRHRETATAIEMIDNDLAETKDMPGSINLRTSLHRLRGYAAMQMGEFDVARTHLDRSLELAGEAGARFEQGLTSKALSIWARESGNDDEWAEDAAAIFEELGVTDPAHLDFVDATEDNPGEAVVSPQDTVP